MDKKTDVTAGSLRLSSGNLSATVDPLGAYLTSMQLNNAGSIDLIYPKQDIVVGGKKKVRGGSHICFPNFGPDAGKKFAQHGIGRVLPWSVKDQTVNSISLVLNVDDEVVLRLQQSQPGVMDYQGVVAELIYQIAEEPDATLIMKLVINNGARVPLRMSPGFHPYFQLPPGTSAQEVSIKEESKNKAQSVGRCDPSYEKEFDAADGVKAACNQITLHVTGTNMTKITYWSDAPTTFICIEPTAYGASFSDTNLDSALEVLKAGESREYAMKVRWTF